MSIVVEMRECRIWPCTDFGSAPACTNQVACEVLRHRQLTNGSPSFFGMLNEYRKAKGLPQDVDVTPPNAAQLAYDKSATFTPFHMNSMCVEDMSPYWNESHNA